MIIAIVFGLVAGVILAGAIARWVVPKKVVASPAGHRPMGLACEAGIDGLCHREHSIASRS